MNRAYSLINVKAIDEGRRIFSGVATTPEVDRMNDTIDPLGAKFKNPTVLLHQHVRDRPIGSVKFHKPTKDGIAFDAEIPVIEEAGALKDRVDTAWGEIKAGLVRAVSIGFKPIKYAFKEDGGIDFQEIEIIELSTVSIPANAGAIVTSVGKGMTASDLAVVKQFDGKALAASGIAAKPSQPTPASGITINLKGTAAMNVGAQIAALEAQRKEKASAMEAIQKKVTEEGRTKNQDERKEFDEIRDELKVIDAEIKDLKDVEELHVKPTAKPVDKADGNGGTRPTVHAAARKKDPPGIAFARIARVKALSRLEYKPEIEVAEKMYGRESDTYHYIKTGEIAPGATVSGNWGSFLVGAESGPVADFAEYLNARTILGRFGSDGIPALHSVSFRAPLLIQTEDADGYWVGEAKPKPATYIEGDRNVLNPLKCANTAYLSVEHIRDSSPNSDNVIRDALTAALVKVQDVAFIDPSNAGIVGVKPASILNGAPSIATAGSDYDDADLDIRSILQKFIDAKNPLTSGVWIMSPSNAVALSMLRNELGQRVFDGVGINGGTLMQLPVITSEHVGTNVSLINAQDIHYADHGEITVDMSREASVEMKVGGGPTEGNANQNMVQNPLAPGTGTSLVSLWQNNLVGFLAEKTVNWRRRRPVSAAYLTGVAWGGAVNIS